MKEKKRNKEKEWLPASVLLPGKSQGQRSLAGTEEPGRDRGAWQAVFYGVSKKLDIKRPILSLFCSLHYEKKINYTIVQNI